MQNSPYTAYFLGKYEPNEELARANGLRYKPWSLIAPHWYANTGITRPHIEFIQEPKRTYNQLLANSIEVASLYEEKISSCVQTIQQVFAESNATVIFESNGTAALALLRAIAGAEGKTIIMTSDMGRITQLALEGKDTSILASNFSQQVGLFAPTGKLTRVQASKVVEIDLYEGNQPKSMNLFCSELFSAIETEKPKFVVVPQVSRTGIKLPVEKIGKFIRSLNEKNDLEIVYAVDGAQSIGRMTAEETQNPLNYCDAYFFVGQKALGAMTVAAIVAKPELVENNIESLTKSSMTPRFCHYQFSPTPPRLQKFLQSTSCMISLPEIESLDLSLKSFYWRSPGRTFAERRVDQVKKIMNFNQFIVKNLEDLPGIRVFKAETAGMISFLLEKGKVSPEELKWNLQQLQSPITLPPIYQKPILRIGLNELRPQDLGYLVDSIKSCLK